MKSLLLSLTETNAEGVRRILKERPLAAAVDVQCRLRARFPLVLRALAVEERPLSDILQRLAELPFTAAVTTSYSALLPSLLGGEGRPVHRVLGGLALTDPAESALDGLLWTHDDLRERRVVGDFDELRRLFATTTFFFVGFERGDPDLGMFLERVVDRVVPEVEHFALLPGLSRVEEEELWATHHIRVVTTPNPIVVARGLLTGESGEEDDEPLQWRAKKLEREAAGHPDARRAAELYLELGDLHEAHLGQPAQAISCYRRALERAPGYLEAWEALEEIHRRRGEPEALVAFIAGTGDRKAALARFERARAENPSDALVLAVLDRLYELEGAVGAQLEVLEARAALEPPTWQAEIFHRAGKIARRELDSHDRAELLQRKALRAAPGHVPSLVCLYDLLDVRGARGEADELLRQLEAEEAAVARLAHERPDDVAVTRVLGELLWTSERFDEARGLLSRFLERHEPDLGVRHRIELHARVGACALLEGHFLDAHRHLAEALELDPGHAMALRALLALPELSPAIRLEATEALLAVASDDERGELLISLGDLYLDVAEDPKRAIGVWRAALQLRPEDHGLLHRCLDVYVAHKKWARALDILGRLANLEKTPSVRARVRATAASICRDELDLPDRAIRLLWAAIDDDPSLARAARALEELLRRHERWPELARLYARVLEALGPQAGDGRDAERYRLWAALGQLCQRPALGNPAPG